MPKKAPPRKDHNKVPRAPREITALEPREAERVAKVIARAGLGSRREIEEWILAGRVAVNGEVLESPARTVTAQDLIEVDGTPIPAKERTRLFLYHKPKGVVTTNFDPEGRATLFEILPQGLPRLVSVGRLDLNTEGLILLTNDGGLSRLLELPETGWLRRYRVRAKGEITQDKLDALIKGVTVDGVHYGPIEAALDRVQGANVWLTLALREGKNREVRNVLGSLGLDVNRLIRLSYGPFQLGEIAQGAVEEVRTRVLADQLGPELSAAAGADFDGPVFDHAVPEEEAPARAAKPAGKAGAKGPRYAKPEGGEDRHRRRPIDLEESADRSVTSGLVADRKGRKVLVQRVRSTETASEEERPARPLRERERREGEREAKRARPVREPRPGGGTSTFRKRPEGDRPPRRDRPEGERSERPFRERTPRPEGERAERPFRSRPDGERGFRPRTDSERPPRRERPEGERSERPFRERTPRPEGERAERP
ncbi:pseudouridine synthase, partial [Ancylobacter sp. A5.8]|uniref:pseudouridine synthase n=1 Tax=Ancylobacter gelatini TaxID=2919920 RepID=UPI001F4E8116